MLRTKEVPDGLEALYAPIRATSVAVASRTAGVGLNQIFSLKNKKHRILLSVFKEVPDGFEPPIRELQSHALPLGYGTK